MTKLHEPAHPQQHHRKYRGRDDSPLSVIGRSDALLVYSLPSSTSTSMERINLDLCHNQIINSKPPDCLSLNNSKRDNIEAKQKVSSALGHYYSHKKQPPSKWDDAEKWVLNSNCNSKTLHTHYYCSLEATKLAKNNRFQLVREDSRATTSDSELTNRHYNHHHHYHHAENYNKQGTVLVKSVSYKSKPAVQRQAAGIRQARESTSTRGRKCRSQCWDELGMSTQDKYEDSGCTAEQGIGNINNNNENEDENEKRMKDAATEISPCISRRDMGTQMTPPLCGTPVKSTSPARHNTPARPSSDDSASSPLQLDKCHLAKLKLLDLPSSGSTIGQLNSVSGSNSGKGGAGVWGCRLKEEDSLYSKCLVADDDQKGNNKNVALWKKRSVTAWVQEWHQRELAKLAVRHEQEEAKIEAWEKLQKVKAEEEFKKVEVKLEKLRTQALEKMIKKLASTQKRAQEMKALAQVQEAEHITKTIVKTTPTWKIGRFPSPTLTVCFARPSSTSPT